MARTPSEQQESIAFAAWLRKQEKAGHLTFTHVPNEGRRPGREGANAKAMGMRKGFPDYLVVATFEADWPSPATPRVLAVELKRRDAPPGEPWGVRISQAHLRPEQAQWLELLSSFGLECRACAGSRDAVEWVSERLGLAGGRMHSADMENESKDEPQVTQSLEGLIGEELYLHPEPLTVGQLSKRLEVDTKTLRPILAAMRKAGTVVTTGQRRGTRYALASKQEVAAERDGGFGSTGAD